MGANWHSEVLYNLFCRKFAARCWKTATNSCILPTFSTHDMAVCVALSTLKEMLYTLSIVVNRGRRARLIQARAVVFRSGRRNVPSMGTSGRRSRSSVGRVHTQ